MTETRGLSVNCENSTGKEKKTSFIYSDDTACLEVRIDNSSC